MISVIIPCFNEEKFIAKCLDSIISQDLPRGELEVLVVDGMSNDRTREIVKKYCQKYDFIRLLNNPDKTTPFAMNIGIKNAKGEFIAKMDAHTIYEKNYLSLCVEGLKRHNADNAGGVIISFSSENTLASKSIAMCMSSRFGGWSSFRTGALSPKEVDAVAFGCFRKELFSEIGLYNTELARSQDMELNLRIKKNGGKIMLIPDAKGYYYYSKNNLAIFFSHNFIDGLWVFYPLKFGRKAFSFRHIIPFLFVLSLLCLGVLSFFSVYFLWLLILDVGLYLFFSLYFSYKIAIKEKSIRLLFLMPLVFGARHIGYGLGSIFGIIWIFVKKKKQVITTK